MNPNDWYLSILRDIKATVEDEAHTRAITQYIKHQGLLNANKTHAVIVNDVIYDKGQYIIANTIDNIKH